MERRADRPILRAVGVGWRGVPIPAAQRWMLGVIALAVPFGIWEAMWPENSWLQVGPVALGLIAAIPALRRWPLSNLSAGCICAFVLLHLFAARWTYSYVPYDDWLDSLAGVTFGELFGWERNMFDRLVHFLFGMLAMPVIGEIGLRYARLERWSALLVAALAVLATGAVYEIFEWSLTMTLAPESAGAYNGEQGDRFDSQKDMALAALGALLALPIALRHLGRIANCRSVEHTGGND